MQFVEGLPAQVKVGQTRIQHINSLPASDSQIAGFNLALHVGDDAQRVQQHRIQLLQEFAPYGVHTLTWMNQTHSTICQRMDGAIAFNAAVGDGLVTSLSGHALMMMTADCLPVVLGNDMGTEVANLHAGWRGLAQGIVENTVQSMQTQPTWAWLGAAISQACFEVGAEVKAAFCEKYPALDFAFQRTSQANKYHADLYAIARYILKEQGVKKVLGGDQCSYTQVDDYFSYRRHSTTGRMATFVFIAEKC